jgi:hypothetical protein
MLWVGCNCANIDDDTKESSRERGKSGERGHVIISRDTGGLI